MNKLIFTDGGQPIKLDDLQLLQDAAFTGFEAILKALANCVLSGCEVSIENEIFSVSEGFVAINNSIYKVDPQSINLSDTDPNNYYIVPEETQTSLRVFQDSSVHNVHEIRKGILITSDSIPADSVNLGEGLLTSLSFIEQITQLPNAILTSIQGTWNPFIADIQTDEGSLDIGIFKARFKAIGKTVFFHLHIDGVLPATNNIVMSIPAGLGRANSLFKSVQLAHVKYPDNSRANIPVHCNSDVYPDDKFTLIGPFSAGDHEIYGEWIVELA